LSEKRGERKKKGGEGQVLLTGLSYAVNRKVCSYVKGGRHYRRFRSTDVKERKKKRRKERCRRALRVPAEEKKRKKRSQQKSIVEAVRLHRRKKERKGRA